MIFKGYYYTAGINFRKRKIYDAVVFMLMLFCFIIVIATLNIFVPMRRCPPYTFEYPHKNCCVDKELKCVMDVTRYINTSTYYSIYIIILCTFCLILIGVAYMIDHKKTMQSNNKGLPDV
jgi:hypothetical protein